MCWIWEDIVEVRGVLKVGSTNKVDLKAGREL